MENIIKKLESAYEDCVQLKEKLTIQLVDLVAKEEKFNAKGRELAELTNELKLREAEVKKIEDPLSLLESIKAAKLELAGVRAGLDQKLAAFNEENSKSRKEISQARMQITSDKELIAKELSELKKAREALREEKTKLKEGILKDLAKKL